MRRVSLDEIAESTKIARRHLESLEKEDFDSLPGGVFNKGFVRAYARFIGIDEEQAVADYAELVKEEPPPEDKFPLEVHEEPNRELNPRNVNYPLIAAAVALVVLLAGYAVWHSKRRPADNARAVMTAGPAGQKQDGSLDGPRLASEGHKSADPAGATHVSTIVAAARKTPESAHPRPQPPVHTFFVVIKAKEDSWISVIADGRRVKEGVLRAEKQRFVKAAKEIIVKTGNAGGIEISYNGRPLGAIGSESETRTLMFTPTGPAEQ